MKSTSLTVGTASTTFLRDYEGKTFSYSILDLDGTDGDAFTINPSTGELSLKEQPDYEIKSSYIGAIGSTDSDGKSYNESFDIAVENANEDPYFSSFASDGVIEDSVLEVSGTVEAFDPDRAQIDYSINSKGVDVSLSDGVYTATAAFGTLVLNSETGSYTYSLNNSSEAVQSLSSSDSFNDVFTVVAFDGSRFSESEFNFQVEEAQTTILKNPH